MATRGWKRSGLLWEIATGASNPSPAERTAARTM
jgi:hypothetical protein